MTTTNHYRNMMTLRIVRLTILAASLLVPMYAQGQVNTGNGLYVPGTSNGVYVDSNGSLVISGTGSINAPISGNAATATALAATPNQCSAGTYATGITASGTANCGTVAYSQISSTPSLPANTTATGSQWFTAYNSSTGAFTKAQPAYSDISGTPTLAATKAAVTSNYLTSYTASTGAFTAAQPACSDLSNSGAFCSGTDAGSLTGTVAAARLNPSTAAHLFLGNNTGSTTSASFVQLACADLSNSGTGCSSAAGVPTTRNVSTSSPLGGGGALSADLTMTCATCAVTGTTISTTSPLGGGGDLSANRTLTCTTCITTSASQVLNHPTIGISGTSASAQILSVGSAPSCAFSTGGGSSPSCAMGTGSTDFSGVITATTGSGSPGSSGTITLTFNASMGTNTATCVAMAATGASAWSTNPSVQQTTYSKTAPVFTWSNQSATAAVALTASTSYKINYLCVGI